MQEAAPAQARPAQKEHVAAITHAPVEVETEDVINSLVMQEAALAPARSAQEE